jgi:hypothetical protein
MVISTVTLAAANIPEEIPFIIILAITVPIAILLIYADWKVEQFPITKMQESSKK